MTIPPLGGIQPFVPPSIQPPAPPSAPASQGAGAGSAAGTQAPAGGFGSTLSSAISSLNESQLQADRAAQALASGGGDIAGAMIATEKASLQLQFAFAVRNRAISAYQQIMAMQV
jgi:flagellar hook-basal body complex protein FliE